MSVKCEICGYENKRSIMKHLIEEHDIHYSKYIEMYPNSKVFTSEKKKLQVEEDIRSKPLKCEICGYVCKSILTKHIRSAHNMSEDEYLKLYPNSKLFSDEWKQMMSDRNKSQKMRDITISRNKEQYMRDAISNRNKNPEFIKKCKEGIKNSETWHDVHSVSTTKRNKEMWKDPEYAEKMTNILRNSNIERWKDPEYAKRMLDILPSKYGKKQKYYSEYFNKEFSLKSNSELSFVKLCERLKVSELIYEPFGIQYEWKDKTIHTYYPDFLVDNKYIVEVKWDESYRCRNNLYKSIGAINYCKNNDYKFCWYQDRYNSSIENINDIVLCQSKIE